MAICSCDAQPTKKYAQRGTIIYVRESVDYQWGGDVSVREEVQLEQIQDYEVIASAVLHEPRLLAIHVELLREQGRSKTCNCAGSRKGVTKGMGAIKSRETIGGP